MKGLNTCVLLQGCEATYCINVLHVKIRKLANCYISSSLCMECASCFIGSFFQMSWLYFRFFCSVTNLWLWQETGMNPNVILKDLTDRSSWRWRYDKKIAKTSDQWSGQIIADEGKSLNYFRKIQVGEIFYICDIKHIAMNGEGWWMNDVFPRGGLALYCGFPIHHSSPYSSVICRLVILPSQIPQMVKDMELPRTTLVTAEKCLLPRMWLKKTTPSQERKGIVSMDG